MTFSGQKVQGSFAEESLPSLTGREGKELAGFDLKWWRSRTAEEIVSSSRRALDLSSFRLTTGSETVDKVFNGGIPKHILFEITVSPAGWQQAVGFFFLTLTEHFFLFLYKNNRERRVPEKLSGVLL